MMHTFALRLNPLQIRKLDLYHWDDADMVTELKTEQVGTSAVLGLDKASVSTRQLIIMDTKEWQQRESFFLTCL